MSIDFWIGFFSLPQTPKAAYDRLVSASETVSKTPNLIKKLTDIGFNIEYKGRAEFIKFLQIQWDDTTRIIKETGIKVE